MTNKSARPVPVVLRRRSSVTKRAQSGANRPDRRTNSRLWGEWPQTLQQRVDDLLREALRQIRVGAQYGAQEHGAEEEVVHHRDVDARAPLAVALAAPQDLRAEQPARLDDG